MKKKRRPPPRVLQHLDLTPCPDCAARFDADRRLVHEDSCPLSAGIEDVCARDRAWFRANPEASMCTRPVSRAERMELGHVDPDARPSHVHVTNYPWGRVRSFCNDDGVHGLVLDPDSGAA